jgi:L-cystine uptake protein TcyP (sodium:dicarboxylate symporter family)
MVAVVEEWAARGQLLVQVVVLAVLVGEAQEQVIRETPQMGQQTRVVVAAAVVVPIMRMLLVVLAVQES